MRIFSYEFENLEDREMAFHNIAKWYGKDIVERVSAYDLTVYATADVLADTLEIIEKHSGRLKLTPSHPQTEISL